MGFSTIEKGIKNEGSATYGCLAKSPRAKRILMYHLSFISDHCGLKRRLHSKLGYIKQVLEYVL